MLDGGLCSHTPAHVFPVLSSCVPGLSPLARTLDTFSLSACRTLTPLTPLHSFHSLPRSRSRVHRKNKGQDQTPFVSLRFLQLLAHTLRGCSAMRSSMHNLNGNRRLFLSLPKQSSSSTRWFASKSKSKVSILIPDTRYLIPDHLYLYLIRRVHPIPPSHIPRIIFHPTTRPKSSHIQIT